MSTTAPVSETIRIGIAIVEHRESILVGVRDSQVVLGGLHEFPGGKCLPEESPQSCTRRECFEETGLHVEIVELLDQTHHVYAHGAVELNFFLCRLTEETESAPAGPFQWTPLQELSRLSFPEGNRTVIAKLQHRDRVR